MDCAAGGMQLAAERVVIAELAVVRLRVSVSRRADILEISLHQRRFVFRESRSSFPGGRSAGAQKERTKRDTEKREMLSVTQQNELLTAIHNPMQEYFFANRRLGTTKCRVVAI